MSNVTIKCPYCQKDDEYDLHEDLDDRYGISDGEQIEMVCSNNDCNMDLSITVHVSATATVNC